MIRNMKYTFLLLIRDHSTMFWMLIFPICLGLMFNVAFSNLAAVESVQTIPVAIVLENTEYAETFKEMADSLQEGDDPILEATYCNTEEALDLLSDKKVDGIITADKSLSLQISGNMANASLNQSILQTLVQNYILNYDAMLSVITDHPEHISEVAELMSEDLNFNKEVSLSKDSSVNSYSEYFYNLLAMACLFGGMVGVNIALKNQGNLSDLGARRNISPTRKSISITGELAVSTIFQFGCNAVGFFFFIFVLKVNMGSSIPLGLLTVFCSDLLSICMGFFIGSIGNISENAKQGIVIIVTMSCCFLSGLMVGSMRIIVDQIFPLFNHINPSALISDCFYSLSVYDTYTRFTQNLLTILGLSLLFAVAGFVLTRRKKYASL